MSTESVKQKRSEEKVRLYLDEKREQKQYHEKISRNHQGFTRSPRFRTMGGAFKKKLVRQNGTLTGCSAMHTV